MFPQFVLFGSPRKCFLFEFRELSLVIGLLRGLLLLLVLGIEAVASTTPVENIILEGCILLL
jgi:hypothetical protein